MMIRLLLSLLSVVALPTVGLTGNHRVALLIGNADYDGHRFEASVGDTEAVAQTLRKHGFRTTLARDLKSDSLKKTIESFARGVPTRGTAVVYFSGIALTGERKGVKDTFLIPTDATLRDVGDVGNRGVSLTEVFDRLTTLGGASANVIIVDGRSEWSNVPPGLSAPERLPDDGMICFPAPPGKPYPDSAKDRSSLAVALTRTLTNTRQPLSKGFREASSWSRVGPELIKALDRPASVTIAPSDQLRDGSRAGDEWVNARGMVFCWCPPGTFTFGDPEQDGTIEVTFRHGFWMAKYELTKRENLRNTPHDALATHRNEPITRIHFDNGRGMPRTLTQEEQQAGRLPSGWEYALPTEAEWEYAARAGTTTRFSFGDEVRELPQHANFADKSLYDTGDGYYNYADRQLDDGTIRLARVGSYRPNPWGLHDMSGNVWEWCDSDYGSDLTQVNVQDSKGRGYPTIRGGSWVSRPESCQSAYRRGWPTRQERNFIGFRFVLRKSDTDR